MHPFITVLISMVFILCSMYLLFTKPWLTKPKVGEIWEYQANDPFDAPILYKILDIRKGYIQMETIEAVYPYPAKYKQTFQWEYYKTNFKKVSL